jgi:hypothetical protein
MVSLLGRLRPRATPLRAVYDAKELVPCPGALKLGKLLIGINGCRSVTVTGSRIATILGVLPDQLGAGDFLFA